MAIKNQIQFRRGSSSEWVAISGGDGPALSYGEPGFDVTNNILKIGDGSTSWKDLKPVGADQSLYKVKNTSGGIIYKGQVVRANGTVGNSDAIQVTLFIADGSVPEYTVMGLATQDMNNNDFGYVTAFGQIRGIDTDPDNLATNICAAGENWEDGDILYASPTASGKLTKNKPQHDTIVAIVLNLADNGSLFVRPTWNPHLDDIHDVNTSGVTNNQYLRYDSGSQLWVPTSSGIFTNVAIGSDSIPNTPIASLYVKGNIHASGNGFFGTFDNNEYVQVGTLNGDVGLFDYEDSAIAVKQSDGLYNYYSITIDSANNDNVGISNTAPAAKLDVNGDILSEEINIVSAVSGATLFNIEGTNGNLFSVVDNMSGSLMSVNDITGLPAFEVFSDHSIVAGRFNANDFVISSGGNVGIGTTDPAAKLDIRTSGVPGFVVQTSNSQNTFQYLKFDGNNLLRASFDGTNFHHYLGARLYYNIGTNGVAFDGGGGTNQSSVSFTNRAYIALNSSSTSAPGNANIHAGPTAYATSTNTLTSISPFAFTTWAWNGSNGYSINSHGYMKQVQNSTTTGDARLSIARGSDNSELFTVNYLNGNVGIGTTSPSYKLQVNGSFGATTKSFRIDHPSRPNYTLEYGSLESPYHGVRLTGRGRVVKGSGTVLLPSYLKDLIHDDETINIQITNIKHGKVIYVDEIDLNNDRFTVKADRCKTLGDLEFFWTFTGTRKDVDKLVVEAEK